MQNLHAQVSASQQVLQTWQVQQGCIAQHPASTNWFFYCLGKAGLQAKHARLQGMLSGVKLLSAPGKCPERLQLSSCGDGSSPSWIDVTGLKHVYLTQRIPCTCRPAKPGAQKMGWYID